MGKIDDMRRLREEQYAENEQRRAKAAKVATVEPAIAAPLPATPPRKAAEPKAAKAATKAVASDSDTGKCPDCGKVKPLKSGVMANHQKGFGKACPGSRKPPAS